MSDFAARTIGIMLEFACRLDGLALPTLRTWGDARIWPEECEPACCSDTVLRAEPRSDLAPAAGPQTDMDNTSLHGQAAGWLSSGAVRPHGCLTASAPQLRPCIRCHLYRDRADVHNTERALRRNLRVGFSPMVTFWMPHESQLRLPTNPSSQHALRYVHTSDLQCRSPADHMPSTKRVSFDDGVSFWFPSSDQFSLCHSTRCNGNTTRVATSDRRISLYQALFPGGPSVLHESRSTGGGTLCAPLSVPAQPAKGTTHIAVRAPPPAQGSGDDLAIIDELDPVPFPRPVAATAVGSEGRSRFTFFGVVEGHQVLPRQPDWTDAHCIREAIAHAAPALARPMGRTLVSPLQGLFVPQVVLTRMPPRSMYRTVVFDLRPVGAGVRAEDVRLERPVVDVFRGEGALASLCGRMGIGAATLAFSINRLPPVCDAWLSETVETVIVHLPLSSQQVAEAEAVVDGANRSTEAPPRRRGRWSEGAGYPRSGTTRAVPSSVAPVPPTPSVAADAAAAGQGILAFTVFDVHNHRRTLLRDPSHDVRDMIAIAAAQTPQIEHCQYRVHDHVWNDLPTPQITIWDRDVTSGRVFPVRNVEQHDLFCTVHVPLDASPLQVMIEAGLNCDAFRSLRFQVARLESLFLVNHVAVPPFDTAAIRSAHIATVRSSFGPMPPSRRCPQRWQPETPGALQVLAPGATEDLWPVLEVVVHFQSRPDLRVTLDLQNGAGELYRIVTRALGLSDNSGFRLPSYCPVEPGSPLHLYLHEYQILDPWNDPPEVRTSAWGLVDIRRIARPPRPPYIMLPLPRRFDVCWLRSAISEVMPELPAVASAYMGPDLIVDLCAPRGNTPLLTVYPRAHFVFEPSSLAHAILDTHALLDLRPGFNHFRRVDRRREQQLPMPGVAASSSSTSTHLDCFPGAPFDLLETAAAEDSEDHEREEVLVFCPGQTARCICIPRLATPEACLHVAAASCAVSGPCTLTVPTLAPLVIGHIPSVVVLPSAASGRRFLIVDARRVGVADYTHLWLQETEGSVTPVSLIALLRRTLPDLRHIGMFYLDTTPLCGQRELRGRVALLTVLPVDQSLPARPTPFLNLRSFRGRPGFLQLDMRSTPPRSTTSTVTQSPASNGDCSMSTSTTTTGGIRFPRSPAAQRGASVMRVEGQTLIFHLGCDDGHVEHLQLTGRCTLEDVMSQLCVQLLMSGELREGLRFQMCERVIRSPTDGYQIFVCAHDAGAQGVAWLDAAALAVTVSTIRLPFTLTAPALVELGINSHDGLFYVAVNGAPWKGIPRQLQTGDVVSVRLRFSDLFSLPLAGLETRVVGITAFLLSQPGPDETASFIRDAANEAAPALRNREGYSRAGIYRHWRSISLNWQIATGTEGGYERCVLVAPDIPPFVFTAGSHTPPNINDVNLRWRTHMRRAFGSRTWYDTGLAYGAFTVMFDRDLRFADYRPWIVVIDEVVDVVIADQQGNGLAHWPCPEGWRLNPILTLGPIGQAALQLEDTAVCPLLHQELPASPGIDDTSSDHEYSLDEGLPWEWPPEEQEISSDDGSVTFTGAHVPTVDVPSEDEAAASDVSLLQIKASVTHCQPVADVFDAVGETTPRPALRRIATPCRNRSRAAAQGGARATPTGEAQPPASLAPVPICLSSLLVATPAPCSQPVDTKSSLDALLEALAPFDLSNLYIDRRSLPALDPKTHSWVHAMSAWNRQDALDSVTIYTDGSFGPRDDQCAWAVVCIGEKDSVPYFMGVFADSMFRQCCDRCPCELEFDAHAAELVALSVAMSIVAAADGKTFRVIGDCTSALQIAAATSHSRQHQDFSRFLLDLHLIGRQRGNGITFQHVHSHTGNYGNELADSLAKAASTEGLSLAANFAGLNVLRNNGSLSWAWWNVSGHSQSGQLPGLSDAGVSLPDGHQPLSRFHGCATVPGVPLPVCDSRHSFELDATWTGTFATYNANSLKKEADRQCLDRRLHKQGVHVAGVQEARSFPGSKFQTEHFTCFASPDDKGSCGCQLWVDGKRPLACRADDQCLCLDVGNAVILHADPRVIAVSVPAGKALFTFISAHAPIAAAPAAEREAWWHAFARVLRKIPRRAIPIVMIDANARFDVWHPGQGIVDAKCCGDNAHALQAVAEEHDLQVAGFHDKDGHRLVTWTSPYGKDSQIDYVLIPTALAESASVWGTDKGDRQLDHHLHGVRLRWHQPATATRRVPRWDRRKLASEEGKQILQQVFRDAPAVPWTFDVEDHLHLLNTHIYLSLSEHFIACPRKPRQPHISDQQWQCIQERRHARRLQQRIKCTSRKMLLHCILLAWRRGTDGTPLWPGLYSRKRHRMQMQQARLACAIRVLTQCISKSSVRDAAEHTRRVLRDARHAGPAELYGALRGVMKAGRRYKQPQALPALCINDCYLSDPSEVRQALTEHFAEPEHGVTCRVADIVSSNSLHLGSEMAVDITAIPSVAEVAQGFLALTDNRAPGISTIPAEVYRHAALAAAECHAPVLVKIAARGRWPAVWRDRLGGGCI